MATRRASVPAPEKPTTAAPVLDAIAPQPDLSALERLTVDPKALVLDANARSQLKITPGFRASISEHGVLVPLLCRRDALGQLLVVDGQRRLVTALEVGRTSVPIAMLPPVGDDEARLWDQLVSNDHREALTAAETAQAYHQLTLMGRSAETIAKRAGKDRAAVETALTVAKSKAATSAAAAVPEATLDQLAALAEFEDDREVTKSLKKLVSDPGQFRHAVSSARDDRLRQAAIADFVATLPEGTRLLTSEEYSYNDNIDHLLDKAGGRKLTPENHATCEGHAVYVVGRVVGPSHERVGSASAGYVCTGWKKRGHVDRYASSHAATGPATDEQKAERRSLITNNKAADAAEPVRRQFIRDLLQRKTFPKDGASYVALVLWHGRQDSPGDAHTLAREFLYGSKEIRDQDLVKDLARASDLPLRYLVALAAAHVEGHMPRDFWHKRSSWFAAMRVAHLRQLQAWGYTLSDVEALAVKTHGGGA